MTKSKNPGRAATLMQKHGALITLAVICVLATMRYETFLTPENILNVLKQNSVHAFVALGMTFVIMSRGVDLSVGSIVALGGIVAAGLTPYGSVPALLGGIIAGLIVGIINGWLVAKARIQPFITTLATMIAVRGIVYLISHENTIRADRHAGMFRWLGRGEIGELPVPVILLFLSFLIGWIVLRHTKFGRHVYALGDNDEAARLLGLNTDRVTIAVYAISGALAAFAGLVLASRLGAGQPVAGNGWELDAITAVVVGGTLLSGGQGGAGSTLIGVLLLGVILNIFNLEGTLSSYWQWVLRGVFLLTVVVVQSRLAAKKD
jgi:ribose transport system permease protein